MKYFLIALLAIGLASCGHTPPPQPSAQQDNPEPLIEDSTAPDQDPAVVNQEEEKEPEPELPPATGAEGFTLEAWADNWFAAYLGEELIIEDSVPITTERSFNSETKSFDGSFPLQLNFILKDFKENDTGLEYIGTFRQQMGDGGFIMQVTDNDSGRIVGVSNDQMRCLVIHDAPTDKQCAIQEPPVAGQAPCEFVATDEPAGWKSPGFDDSSWAAASVYSADDVSPKDGYAKIRWDQSAQFVWGPDLETNNTVLCRVTIDVSS